jgi:L-cysteine:1D-myo-inositol 2-amino-2-deoxy-alpha-D-glucopyranoside ligase
VPLRVFDSASGQLQPAQSKKSRLYVCGITPYDATHLGHAATYVAFDLMQRVWLDNGIDINYVQNVTDIDDPLLERANATGQDWAELARAETHLFREDMAALRVLPPREYIGAVEAIPEVVKLIQQLQVNGAAYELEGDVYFSVSSDPSFGHISHLSRDEMVAVFAERGGDPQRRGKKDPLDSLLWQAEREGEPAWDSAIGRGRPGWHIECAAIALQHLGDGFDVQGGGSDLAFPHHEMCAAQAQIATGKNPFARTYVHAGMVGLDGLKMSKSKGNLVFVSRLRDDGRDPMAIRLALLAHHYRDDWEWEEADLLRAEARLTEWQMGVTSGSAPDAGPVIHQIRERLADDLDAPGALELIDAWADAALAGDGDSETAPAELAEAVDALLGVELLREG